MKTLRLIGSLAFVLGLFTAIFVGIPWYVYHDPTLSWWLKTAIYCLMGGILLVLLMVAIEQRKGKVPREELLPDESRPRMLLQNSTEVPGREITEMLGLVKGHTIFAIWLGKDLSALVRLVLGGELTEYTEMMGRARKVATDRMMAQAEELGADAIINVRYMTTSVIGSAAELLAYGTGVKLSSTVS
ncbi:YbjQ family protein [candidate division KSB1 bacterium]|nr:YbjQ family protein [candidate division KSB1 bacterium]